MRDHKNFYDLSRRIRHSARLLKVKSICLKKFTVSSIRIKNLSMSNVQECGRMTKRDTKLKIHKK